ncbi:hypothetical protein GALL_422760 [mine drainage metagenome]|uniref:Uncharacterized protein n=1 Tax=mine drainage metagenome TaxID=410659 RepID=A0A1J5PYN8_9ZZZZ
MNRHLVTVKVGIESRTNQRMQLNGFALDQDRLKGLNAQAVQGWRTVEHDRVLFDDFFENVPHHWRTGFNLFFGRLDGGGNTHGLQARKNERLEQFQRHQLGQTTLMQLERGADHND